MVSLSAMETLEAMHSINVYFQYRLSYSLNLLKVDAPMVLPIDGGFTSSTGTTSIGVAGTDVEVVQSLNKWKRYIILLYDIPIGKGIYAESSILRPHETLSPIHALTIKQYDWEIHIDSIDRSIDYLYRMVILIYKCLVDTQAHLYSLYPSLSGVDMLPRDIHIISSSDLEGMYPSMCPKDRERAIVERYGAAFISQIGYKHDTRVYDDDSWDLNGDLLVWSSVLNMPMKLSSMGIRVDGIDLLRQCNGSIPCTPYHDMVINGAIPLTIGGGIGQSRLYMFLLHKEHIAEVMASIQSGDITTDAL